ncbi:hypothetical protein AAF712_003950 [Marasmius tenuissimus]|uniref:Uncharacterized protein n=1 Tax=Marasmius tenuissimus TaxID=585030 RepID=A0ABR3A4S0_9AGAR
MLRFLDDAQSSLSLAQERRFNETNNNARRIGTLKATVLKDKEAIVRFVFQKTNPPHASPPAHEQTSMESRLSALYNSIHEETCALASEIQSRMQNEIKILRRQSYPRKSLEYQPRVLHELAKNVDGNRAKIDEDVSPVIRVITETTVSDIRSIPNGLELEQLRDRVYAMNDHSLGISRILLSLKGDGLLKGSSNYSTSIYNLLAPSTLAALPSLSQRDSFVVDPSLTAQMRSNRQILPAFEASLAISSPDTTQPSQKEIESRVLRALDSFNADGTRVNAYVASAIETTEDVMSKYLAAKNDFDEQVEAIEQEVSSILTNMRCEIGSVGGTNPASDEVCEPLRVFSDLLEVSRNFDTIIDKALRLRALKSGATHPFLRENLLSHQLDALREGGEVENDSKRGGSVASDQCPTNQQICASRNASLRVISSLSKSIVEHLQNSQHEYSIQPSMKPTALPLVSPPLAYASADENLSPHTTTLDLPEPGSSWYPNVQDALSNMTATRHPSDYWPIGSLDRSQSSSSLHTQATEEASVQILNGPSSLGKLTSPSQDDTLRTDSLTGNPLPPAGKPDSIFKGTSVLTADSEYASDSELSLDTPAGTEMANRRGVQDGPVYRMFVVITYDLWATLSRLLARSYRALYKMSEEGLFYLSYAQGRESNCLLEKCFSVLRHDFGFTWLLALAANTITIFKNRASASLTNFVRLCIVCSIGLLIALSLSVLLGTTVQTPEERLWHLYDLRSRQIHQAEQHKVQ